MNITIFGTGYVGLVTGVCLADFGHQVLCIDIDETKIAQLKEATAPIFEPGLMQLLKHNLTMGRIRFSTDYAEGVAHGIFQFIAVGTPCQMDGSSDLDAVFDVAKKIGNSMHDYRLVITKSTVPVGTANKVNIVIKQALLERKLAIDFDIASNPEFLREGTAIDDFMHPDRIIVGADNERALDYLRLLYMPLIDSGKRFIAMDTRSSELTKYASNAFLATKISFMNEMSLLAEKLQADIEQVRMGMSLDPRIGEHFLFAGCGYGGSCFPKDVQALLHAAKDYGQELKILSATDAVNAQQKHVLITKLRAYFNDNLENKTVAIWGLAFKPNTDDMREASSRIVIDYLLASGVKIQAYDPVAMEEARKLYGDRQGFMLGDNQDQVLQGADVLMVVTEWDSFRFPNFQLIKEKLRHPVIFDGRNLYEPHRLKELGLQYYAIGRGKTLTIEELQ